jgi:hypothetical protein
MKIHTARKDHKCSLCGRKIPQGHKYWRDYQETDEGLIDNKQHTNCELYTKHGSVKESVT